MRIYLKMKNQAGFTLLELLVVIAIIATIGGALLTAYDGLDARAAKGQATFNIAAVDKGIRAFAVVSEAYPNKLDSLMAFDAAATVANSSAGSVLTSTGGGWWNGLHSNLEGTDGVQTTGDGKLAFYALSAKNVTALNNIGITTLRYLTNGSTAATTTIPNRIFDDPTRGVGTNITLTAGIIVPIIECKNFGAVDSSRLRDITGLTSTNAHIVMAVGVGNNSTIISDEVGANSAGFSEAPFYTDVAKTEYGRFLALFHLATDTNDDGIIATSEEFTNAKYVGTIDPKGDWLDEEFAEFTGQKL